MKRIGKTLLGATAATAMAMAAATPAQAEGIDGDDILTGALVLGGIAAVAAIASSGDDDHRDRRYGYNDGRYGDRHDGRYGNRYGNRYGYGMSAEQAVQQCSAAAQRDASRYGRARITRITEVDRDRNGYEVDGRLVVNEGWGRYGRRDLDEGRFTCRIRYGRIDRVRVSGI